jgi:MoaA/NifB/PqqE/SkfB family radical SAM enzyme
MASLRQKYHLLRGLCSGDTIKTGPFYVDIDLTTRCNLHCIGCPFHSPVLRQGSDSLKPNDLSPQLFTTFCTELREMGTRMLILSGSGEPLLHPDLIPMIRTARGFDFRILLSTNGTLLDEDKVRELIESGVETVRISLWAGTKKEYQINYPGADPLQFDRVLDGFRLFSRIKAEMGVKRPSVILYYIINEHNCHRILNMVDLASDIGCDGLWFTPMYDMHGLMAEHMASPDSLENIIRDLKIGRKRLRTLGLLENVRQTLGRYRASQPFWSYQPCYVSWFHVRLNMDGIVIPCGRCENILYHGDLNKRSIHEIWNGPEIQQFRRTTLSKERGRLLLENCDCTMCCFFSDMKKIHRIYRWFSWIPKKKVPKVN